MEKIILFFLGGGKRIGSLESHLGILDNEFEELLAAGKLHEIRP